MKRILLTRPMPLKVVETAHARFDEVVVRDSNTPLGADELRAALCEFDGVMPTLGDLFSAEVMADVDDRRCRILANFGVGYNHIDAQAAGSRGIAVTNTPGVLTNATADLGVTLMLMSARRAGEGERLVRAGKWDGWNPTQMLGLHLTGRAVGIVGMGRIGQAIARRCHDGFGMKVAYFSRSEKTLTYPARRFDDLNALVSAVDIVVLAVPGGSATHHLVNSAVLAQMQPHAHIINISRGDVIDEAALIGVLEAGRIGGAGLDVYENEPEVPARLRALDNVTLLPHLGSAALEVREAMGLMALDNLDACLNKAVDPPNLV